MILNEKRTILKGEDALTLLNNGKLAGRLGGKKIVDRFVKAGAINAEVQDGTV